LKWVKDERKNGKYIWSNGDEYEGDWENEEINGNGTFKSSKGTHYDGEWKSNLKHGKGTLKNQDGIYIGEFENGLK
jgi:hypothetical protein